MPEWRWLKFSGSVPRTVTGFQAIFKSTNHDKFSFSVPPPPHVTRRNFSLSVLATAVSSALTACGGGSSSPLTAAPAARTLDELFAANSVISIPGPVKETVSLNWRDTLRSMLTTADQARLPGLSIAIQTQGSSGTLTLAGDVLSYQPKADKQGTDTATLTVTDGVTTRVVTVNIAGINTLDTTPDAYSLSPQSGVATSTTITSNEITVTGLSPATPVAAVITGDATSQISLDSGATWISMGTPVTVQNGSKIQLRHRTGVTGGTQTTTTLAIAGVSSTFVTTTLMSAIPTAWNLGQTTGVARGSVQNKTITIAGINVAVPLTVTGGVSYSIDGGLTYATAPITVSAGQVVQLRMAASGAYASTVTGNVTAGGRTEAWAVSTMAEPNTAPVFPVIAPLALVEGTAGSVTLPVATDANGDTIAYSTGILPAGFSFDPVSRVLSWNTLIPAGTGAITYIATDSGTPPLSTTTAVSTVTAPRDTPTTYTAPTVTQIDGTSGSRLLVVSAGITDPDGIQAGSTTLELLDGSGTVVLQQVQALSTTFTGLTVGTYAVRTRASTLNKTTGLYTAVTNPNIVSVTVVAAPVVVPPPAPCAGFILPDGTCFVG